MTSETENNNGSILIVDDALDSLHLLTRLLINHGYMVRTSKTAMEALDLVKVLPPELILLDIQLPDLSGYEVCEQLKANIASKDIPVIFLSALYAANDKLKGFEVGGVDYITKPFNPAEVLSRVRTHINLSRMRVQLQAINAEKDKFFSIIAHDLRSPISSFLALTEIIDEGLFNMPREKIQQIAYTMRISAANLYRLLKNLLQWSQMKQGAIRFSPEKIKLLPLIEENIAYIIEAARSKQIEIRFDIPAGTEVTADTNMFQSVIRNLTSNAVKFTPRGGVVDISAKSNMNGAVEIAIKDNGIGMNNEMINNLFNLIAKNGRKGTDGELSSGLGLMLCKEFVEKNGGTLQVESEEGKGSRFCFTLKK
jgi:two-component system, sensor histidine kinase and response regulator